MGCIGSKIAKQINSQLGIWPKKATKKKKDVEGGVPITGACFMLKLGR